MKRLLWWLIAGTSGGYNRALIIKALYERPQNAHQLSKRLGLNYTTIRHHLELLEKNNVITPSGKKYGAIYFLSKLMEENFEVFQDVWEQLEPVDGNDEHKEGG